jgi:transposase-like protein
VVVGDHYGVEAGVLSARVLKWIIVSMIQLPCEKPTLFKGRLGQTSHQAVAELKAEGVLPAQTLVRTNKNLNNLIEQDHRKAPQRYYPMPGFKTFGNAQVTLSGIELANKINKGQFDTSEIASFWG